jgi:hypothetical protein
MKRKAGWLAVTSLVVAVSVAGFAMAGGERTNNKTFVYAVGLWGDFPYNNVQKTVGVPNLIDDMNASDIQFSIHDGDLKAGSGPCPNTLYTDALAMFNSLQKPAIFTPGDNDWTDCDRNAGVNSLERLNYERSVLFSTNSSLGNQTLPMEVQAAPYVENRRWEFKNVMYITANVQGSCNNRCDVAPDDAEWAARNSADISWLNESFAEATDHNDVAVMIISQADPGWDETDKTRAPTRDPKTLAEDDGAPDGFQTWLQAVRDDTIAFARPVVYVNGDSHYFRVDKPLLDSQGRRVENFTRVETFGDHQENNDNDVHWVKALVDPNSRDVFAFQAQMVPANRVAVPSP